MSYYGGFQFGSSGPALTKPEIWLPFWTASIVATTVPAVAFLDPSISSERAEELLVAAPVMWLAAYVASFVAWCVVILPVFRKTLGRIYAVSRLEKTLGAWLCGLCPSPSRNSWWMDQRIERERQYQLRRAEKADRLAAERDAERRESELDDARFIVRNAERVGFESYPFPNRLRWAQQLLAGNDHPGPRPRLG